MNLILLNDRLPSQDNYLTDMDIEAVISWYVHMTDTQDPQEPKLIPRKTLEELAKNHSSMQTSGAV